jgi:PPP family 3-phenylpropionic acid transporter
MLRVFYACYFGAVGVSVVFFPPYLRSLGLSGSDVGWMLSVAPVLHLFVPLGWGWVADRTRRPDLLLRVACLGAAALMVPVVLARTTPGLLLLYALQQSFTVPIVGLADALALERVRRGEDYGRMRLWGSVAFAVASGGLGTVLAARGRTADPLVPAAIGGCLGLAFLAALPRVPNKIPASGEGELGSPEPIAGGFEDPPRVPNKIPPRGLLADRRFLLLLVLAPLHWACATPYHGFLAILMQDHHLSPAVWGRAFVVAMAAEVTALFLFGRLRRRFGLAPILGATFAVTAVRWVLVGLFPAAAPLVLLQTLHFFTFGLYWGTALAWLGECVPARLRATGQTLFTGVTYGIGTIVGMRVSGAIYDASGGAEAAFVTAGLAELVPLALVLILRRLDPCPGTGR